MKNMIISLILVIAMLFAMNTIAKSQSCGDCSATATWTETQDPIISDILGCYFLVSYRYIVCDDGTRLIEITGIEFIPGYNCATLTPELIINQAIRAVLYKSRALFQIQNPNDPFTVAVRTPKCWENDALELNICDTTCCSTQYTLRYIEENYGNYVLTDEPISETVTPICSGSPGGPSACIFICDAHYIPPYEPIYQRSYPSSCSTICNYVWLRLDENYVSFQMGNCTIKAFYDVKDCRGINQLYEFKIYLIRMTGDCDGYTNGEIMQTALKKILKKIFWDNFTNPPYAWIRSVVNHCFQRFNGQLDEKFIINCTHVENCCIIRYRVRDGMYYPQVRLDSVVNESVRMSGCGPYYPCESLCYTFDLEYPQEFQKQGNIVLNDYQFDKMLVKIQPNPADNKINISIYNSNAQKISISIFNAISMQFSYIEIEKPESVIIREINTSGYPPGVYFYKISADGVDVRYDSFVIMR